MGNRFGTAIGALYGRLRPDTMQRTFSRPAMPLAQGAERNWGEGSRYTCSVGSAVPGCSGPSGR